MNNITTYIPSKNVKFKNITGTGYTNKGKNAVSYRLINGQRVPIWIEQIGGYQRVIELIQELINHNYDIAPMARFLNISPATCKAFIKKYLSNDYKAREQNNRKQNIALRKALGQRGTSKSTKGKTYSEIYGTNIPKCGFKRGDLNPNFSRNRYIGCTLKNKSGKLFRSSYEVKFSELLESYNIDYDYEHHFRLCNGKIKIVDFVINDKLVEVTGYAYNKWKVDFDAKIALLHKTYPSKSIIIVSTADNINELAEKHSYAIVLSIDNTDQIVKQFRES